MARRPWREVIVLLASAVGVLVGSSVTRRFGQASPAAAAVEAAPEPPPLPEGASVEELARLPADGDREGGCSFADRGFGDYGAWRKLRLGRLLVPTGRAVAPDGSFPLLVHFHGAEPVRKLLAPEAFDLVIAGVDAGEGSRAYERAFADGAFDELVASIEREVAAALTLPRAQATTIVLTSWSAGYGATAQVLARPHPRVGAVVLLDSLYAGYMPGKNELVHGQLPLFVEAAKAALRGGPPFVLTHSGIMTPGYASTEQVASYLMDELGVRPSAVEHGAAPEQAAPLVRLFEESRLAIRGFAGADRDAHCAHLRLLPGVLRELVLPALR